MNSKKLILSGIIPIFILGSITHFAYDWCSITLLGLVAPINSSIWEHMTTYNNMVGLNLLII